jgi:hypothetical protein
MNAETDPHRSRSKPALPVILELAQEHRKTKGQRGQSGQRARVSGGGNSSRHPMQSQLVQGSMRQPHQAEAQDQRSRAQRLLPAHNKLVLPCPHHMFLSLLCLSQHQRPLAPALMRNLLLSCTRPLRSAPTNPHDGMKARETPPQGSLGISHTGPSLSSQQCSTAACGPSARSNAPQRQRWNSRHRRQRWIAGSQSHSPAHCAPQHPPRNGKEHVLCGRNYHRN